MKIPCSYTYKGEEGLSYEQLREKLIDDGHFTEFINEAKQKASETKFRHKDIDERLKDLGSLLEQKEVVSAEETKAKAKIYIEKGGEVEHLIQKGEKKIALNEVEQEVLRQHSLNIDAKLKEAKGEEFEKLRAESERVLKAIKGGETGAGKSLQYIQEATSLDESLSTFLNDMKEVMERELTPEEVEMVKSANMKVAEAAKELEQIQAEIQKLRAEGKLNSLTRKDRSRGRKQNIEDIKKDREKILARIKEKLADIKGQTSVAIPGAKSAASLISIAPEVVALAKSYAAEGAIKLDDVVDRVQEALKDVMPNISKEDIIDIIAGKYKEKKATAIEEATKRMKDLKDEAKLLTEIADLEKGITKEAKIKGEVPPHIAKLRERAKDLRDKIDLEKKISELEQGKLPDKKDRVERTKEIEDLKTKAKDLRDKINLENRLADLEAGKIPTSKAKVEETRQEIIDLKEKIKKTEKERGVRDEAKLDSAIERNIKEIEKLQKKIDKKDFVKEKRVTIGESEVIRKKFPRKHKMLVDLQVARRKAKHDWDLKVFEEERKKRGLREKAFDAAGGVLNTMKAIKAGIDFSAIMIQNGLAVLGHPVEGAKAIRQSFKDMGSKEKFETNLQQIHNKDLYSLMEKSGLDVLDPYSLHRAQQEEAFSGNLLDIPLKGKLIPKKLKGVAIGDFTTKPFERQFTSLGNNLRVNLFEQRARQLMDEGMTFETHPQEFKDAAKVINNITGRGTMHGTIKPSKSLISSMFWSPSLMASSLNVLGLSDFGLIGSKSGGFYKSLTPKQRTYAYKQVGRGITMGGMLMIAAKQAGADVDMDTNSVNFGSVQFNEGGNRYNVFGTLSGYVRAIAVAVAQFKTIDGAEKKVQRVEGIRNFLRGKVTPLVGMTINAMNQRMYNGDPWTLEAAIEEELTPMSISDEMKNGLEQEGAISMLTRMLPAASGIKVTNERDFSFNDYILKDKENKKLFRDNKYAMPRYNLQEVNVYDVKYKDNPNGDEGVRKRNEDNLLKAMKEPKDIKLDADQRERIFKKMTTIAEENLNEVKDKKVDVTVITPDFKKKVVNIPFKDLDPNQFRTKMNEIYSKAKREAIHLEFPDMVVTEDPIKDINTLRTKRKYMKDMRQSKK